ncbi:MAG: histidine kinase [Bacteroidota bacterium]
MRLRILFIILLLVVQTAHSQEPYRISFGRKDGLPSLNIYHSLKDKNGFQWFSSDLGIIKYDGYNFNLITTEDGLADNENFGCYEDSKGRIWFLSYNGKISFYQNNTFYNDINYPLLKSHEKNGYISRISENTKGEIVLIFSNGTAKIVNLKENKIRTKNGCIIIFHFIQNNQDFYITSKGICDNSLKIKDPLNFDDFNVNVISRSTKKDNRFYFSHLNNIYCVENGKWEKLCDVPTAKTDIISLNIDLQNNIWIGTRNGVFVRNLYSNTKEFECYFKENSISSVQLDFENRIWITTLDNGIYYLPNTTAKILKTNKKENIILSCLTKDKGNNLWGGAINDFYYKINNIQIKAFDAKSSLLSKNNIFQIYFSNNVQYIVGKHAIFLKGKQIKNIPFIGTKTILEDTSNNLWIGANYLLKISKNEINNLSNIGLLSSDKRVFLKERTNTLIQNGDTIWVGTNNGIYKIVNDKISYLSKNYPKTQTIISKLYFDKTSNLLFVATSSNGLFVFQNNKLIKQFTKKDGLNSNTLYSIKKGLRANSLLIGNNFGLNQITFHNNQFTIENLNKLIGIENLKINDTEIIDSTLYLASDEGLLYLNINSLQSSTIIPKLQIEEFSVNGKKITIKPELSFKYYENDISISFTGLSFNSQKNITYFFKLGKKNAKWNTTKTRQINYQGLEPGDYEFQIYATNASGINSKIEKIAFIIRKPFWKTYWFLAILLGLFGIAIFVIWRKRVQSLNEKFEVERHQIEMERDKANLEKQMIELEQKALRMQMNPHFIFNALNTIKGYYSEGNDEKAGDYISKFSMLLRMLLENTDQTISLATEVKMLKLYIELTQIRYKNVFDFDIFVDSKINSEDTAIPTLLLQPIVENAIIHGLAPKKEHGQLNISFEKNDKSLLCKVKDNGIGIKASLEKQNQRQHESKAISITNERLALIENEEATEVIFEINETTDTLGKTSGTEVIIQIPFKTIW